VGRKRIALVVCAALLLASCGGGKQRREDAPNPGHVKLYGGKRGGTATFISSSDVDFLDPGQTYFHFGFMVQLAVNRPLYQYAPDDGTTPVADLAEAQPQISQDHKTITVTLKEGIHYAPPVNREVVSADVKYAIERGFSTNVQSGYARSYFGDLEGAPAKRVPLDRLPSFAGLQTPDRRTLVLKLTKPVAERVAAALSMPLTVPVPREYAERYDRRNPSAYDNHVAFTGPYMVANNASGSLTGHEAGRRIRLVRNPNWERESDFRPAYLNAITIEESDGSPAKLARRTLSGRHLLCCDRLQLPGAFTSRARERFPEQVGTYPTGGTRWVALNTTVAPFDNLNVRRAVVAGFDREALRRTRGGENAGAVAQGYLPPGVVGYDESGGEAGFKDFDWMQHPGGDLALARKYMLAAGKEGVPVTPAGRYAGTGRVPVVALTGNPGSRTAAVAAAQFARLGIKVEVRSLPQDVVFSRFCGVQRAAVAVCPNVAWFKDFPDPEGMLAPTFSGDFLSAERNVNWSWLHLQAIDDAMRKAALLEGDERADAWADINRRIVEQAPGIPYLWDESVQVASADMEAVMSPFSTTWDLSFARVK
jgi:peptide/nickel transport system substrate-binding protein